MIKMLHQNKLDDPRLAESNLIQSMKTKDQLKKNLQYKTLIHQNGIITHQHHGQFIARVNDIENPDILKETELQNAQLKTQARATYKDANAQFKKQRAEIEKQHGKWSVENFIAWNNHRKYQAKAKDAGVSGLGYQISKITSSKPKPI